MSSKIDQKQLAKDIEETLGAEESTALSTPDNLRRIAGLGMRGVDPLDIRPPAILLAQKSSNLTEMTDKFGKEAKVGQYFHTGKKEIFDEFECYFLFASKGTYIDRRKPEEGQKPMYRALGIYKSDLSPFGMTFRSSSLYCLSALFTSSQSQQVPMFAFNVKMEVKKLESEKGIWYVPVCRVGNIEADEVILGQLYERARRLDERTEAVSAQAEDEE